MSRRRLTAPTHPAPRGFTLVELLVVIGIIVVLLGILVPLVGNVRKQAQATNTQAGISQLGAMIQAYHNDHRAYPGPIPNTQLRGAAANNVAAPAGPLITMAENLYLGLLGGLRQTAASTPAALAFEYEPTIAGLGPRALGNTPKKYPAYGDSANVSAGEYTDEVLDDGDGNPANDLTDSAVREFLDRFPDPMPLLYLRARTNAAGVVADVPTPAGAPPEQYDQTQVTPYTGAMGGRYLGVGKEDDGETRLPASTGPLAHGFNAAPDPTAVTKPGTNKSFYPYNIYAALRHPTATPVTARQKDGYILISAGVDRVYGTNDDITNFGKY